MIQVKPLPAVRARRSAWRTRDLASYLMMLPALVLHLAIVGVPVVLTLCLSLTDWNGIGPIRWVGGENFAKLAADGVFWTAFLNNLRWIAIFLTVPIVFGLGVALLLSRVDRGRTLYRALIYLPYILPAVVVGRLWLSLYHPFYGLNLVFEQLGWRWAHLAGIGVPSTAIYYVANAANWHWWPFPAIVFLAALQQLDRSLYEAAAVEGANAWQSFWYITLPLLRPTIVFLLLLATIWGFNSFEYVYVMTKGAPAHASELMATWIFAQMIEYRSAGYASALAVALATISSTVIVLYFWLQRRGWDV